MELWFPIGVADETNKGQLIICKDCTLPGNKAFFSMVSFKHISVFHIYKFTKRFFYF